MKTGEEGGEK